MTSVFALAIALQNLIWGLAQPFTGAIADRFGAARVVLVGGVLYAVGLALMGLADSPGSLSLSAGLLIGIALSGTSFSVLLGVVEVIKVGQQIIDANRFQFPTGTLWIYGVIFFMYFIVCWPLSIVARRLEKRWKHD